MPDYSNYKLHELEEARRLILNALRRTQKELDEINNVIEAHQKRPENNVPQEAPA